MALTWGIAFLSCWLVFNSVSGETVLCMTTREECVNKGFSSISVINNRYLCCAAGFSMNVDNAQCSCTKTSTSRNCDKGPKACNGASMVSSDGQGNTVCCPSGFSMSNQVTSINGMVSKSCTCSQGFGGGSNIQIIGGDGFNSTAFTQGWQRWKQRLQASMAHLHHKMRSVRRRLSSMFSNLLQG